MFCDADDMFYNVCGLWIIFREIDNGGFDTLMSAFLEETINPKTKEHLYNIVFHHLVCYDSSKGYKRDLDEFMKFCSKYKKN